MLDVDDEDIQRFLQSDLDRVVRVVVAVCGDRGRAEDAVQESLVDAWRRDRPVDDLARWVVVAAINRSRSRWRSASAEQRAFERLADQQATRPVEEPSMLDARLAQALQSLPRSQRQVVALHYLLDMSVTDVASCLGMAVGTVKTHLHRGRASLRVALETNTAQEGELHARS